MHFHVCCYVLVSRSLSNFAYTLFKSLSIVGLVVFKSAGHIYRFLECLHITFLFVLVHFLMSMIVFYWMSVTLYKRRYRDNVKTKTVSSLRKNSASPFEPWVMQDFFLQLWWLKGFGAEPWSCEGLATSCSSFFLVQSPVVSQLKRREVSERTHFFGRPFQWGC
jgi:hypothetical protein